MRVILVAMALWLSSTLVYSNCTYKLEDAAGEFIAQVFHVSKIEKLSEQERLNKYNEAYWALLKLATEAGVPTNELKNLMNSYILFEESTREPPPGWDPNDRVGNLLVFRDMAKKRLQLDLALLSYGRSHCTYDNKPYTKWEEVCQ